MQHIQSPITGTLRLSDAARAARQIKQLATAAPADDDVLELLRRVYPADFGALPVPLKIGIHHDIFAGHPDLPKKAVREALKRHTGTKGYLRVLVQGAARYSLHGGQDGIVTEREARIAEKLLNEGGLA